MKTCVKHRVELMANGLCPRCIDPALALKRLKQVAPVRPKKQIQSRWWTSKLGLNKVDRTKLAGQDAALPPGDRDEE